MKDNYDLWVEYDLAQEQARQDYIIGLMEDGMSYDDAVSYVDYGEELWDTITLEELERLY